MVILTILIGSFLIFYGISLMLKANYTRSSLLYKFTKESVDRYCKMAGVGQVILGAGLILEILTDASVLHTVALVICAVGFVIAVIPLWFLVKKDPSDTIWR